jgi:hypothetical protein
MGVHGGILAQQIQIEATTLRKQQIANFMQRVVTVHLDGREFRVYAPAAAQGDALDWSREFAVRHPDNERAGAEAEAPEDVARSVIGRVCEELKRRALEADIWGWEGNLSEGRYYAGVL